MVISYLGDLGIWVDYGSDKPGDVLQRWDYETDGWRDFKQDGRLVTNPFDYTTLPAGQYRVRSE